MSLPSTHNDQPTDANVGPAEIPVLLAWIGRILRAIAFWSAIALPFLYIPLLLSGLHSMGQLTAFLALVAINVVSVVVGHRYKHP